MRLLIGLGLAFLLGGSAFGSDLFTCKVKEDGQTVTVKFAVTNLSVPSRARLVNLDPSPDAGPVLVRPLRLKSGVYSSMQTLNDQGGDIRVDSERLKLFGDGDGVTYTDLVLYKNSGFTKGYVRVYGSGPGWYQAITCVRAKL